MSSLLKEAIIDAKALRESALKNAETSVLQKYSEEVKQTLEKLLEQDELGAEGTKKQIVDDVPLAATDDLSEEEGEIPANMQESGEEVSVNVDLDALQEAVAALEAELNEEDINEASKKMVKHPKTGKMVPDYVVDGEGADDEADGVPAGDDDDKSESDDSGDETDDLSDVPKQLRPHVAKSKKNEEIEISEDILAALLEDDEIELNEEEEELSEDESEEVTEESFDADSLVDAIMEKLTVDMGADLAGWAGRSADSIKHEMEKEMAHRRSTDVEEDMKTLKKAQEELVFENKQLTEKLSQYEGALGELQENLQDVNLSNARLLYTNRVLRNNSFNERQKDKIVEAISNAGSVTEARTIFDTLQSTVAAKPKQSPQSLSEAIGNKRSSVIRATRQESAPSDPLQERMKRLAGIK